MKIIVTIKDNLTNKFIMNLNIIEDIEKAKKQIKKQLVEAILNNPESLKAYKNLEFWKIAETNEELELLKNEKEKLFSYKEIIEEIIKTLEGEKNV